MKSMTFSELDKVIQTATVCIGTQVSEIIFNQDVLLLSFFADGKNKWLIIDVSSRGPLLLVGDERTPFLKKQIKPLFLFLKAHLKGQKLLRIWRDKEYGRRVFLEFADLVLELHLTKSIKNIIVKKDKNQISLNKVKPLERVEVKKIDREDRDPESLFVQWLENKNPKKKTSEDLEKKFQKEHLKKQKGLDKMLARQAELEHAPWAKFADYLNKHQTLKVPKEMRQLLDTNLSLQENINKAFEKAKSDTKKLQGLRARIKEVKVELEGLTPKKMSQKQAIKTPNLLKDAKGRTKSFADGVVGFLGKSGKDNLKLLRNAKPWHLWLHIKDFPGAHGILARNKNQSIADSLLIEAAQWILQQSLTDKQKKNWQGVKCDFLICECRYVVPIKGDKAGRVNYKNERTLTLLCD